MIKIPQEKNLFMVGTILNEGTLNSKTQERSMRELTPDFDPEHPVEVLYGPWRGKQGVIKENLTAGEWLIRLLQEDQYGEVLLALDGCQFRPLA